MKDQYSGVCYNLLLMLLDNAVIGGLLLLALAPGKGLGGALALLAAFWYLPLVIVVVHALFRLYGDSLFYPGCGVTPVEQLKRLTLGSLGIYAVLFLHLGIGRSLTAVNVRGLLLGLLLTLWLLPALRFRVPMACRRLHILPKRILIAGAGPAGRALATQLRNSVQANVEVAGFLDDHASGPEILGRLADHAAVARSLDISYLAMALPLEEQQRWTREFLKTFRHLMWLPCDQPLLVLRSSPVAVGNLGALEVANRLRMPLYRLGKRITELLLAVASLLPVLLLGTGIGVLIKLTSRGPVLYRARRLGLNGKPIYVLKFRTMYQNAEAMLETMLEENPELKREWETRFKLKRDPRITPLGRFLRLTSLDELPQFWNIIRGEMAMIGPRPIVQSEVPLYGPDFAVFSLLRPGISGLWQVSGRSNASYEKRVAMDAYYAANWSIWLDYYILRKTVSAVLLRVGAE